MNAELIEHIARETGYPAAAVRSIIAKAERAGFALVQQPEAGQPARQQRVHG
jgi:hypothetical protein